MFTVAELGNSETQIEYVLHVNQEIEADHAGLTSDRLRRDIVQRKLAQVLLLHDAEGRPCGLVLFSFTYWASDGEVLWVSQFYIEPSRRRGPAFLVLLRALKRAAAQRACAYIVWATHQSNQRSMRLWRKAGAKDLSGDYSFWCKKI